MTKNYIANFKAATELVNKAAVYLSRAGLDRTGDTLGISMGSEELTDLPGSVEEIIETMKHLAVLRIKLDCMTELVSKLGESFALEGIAKEQANSPVEVAEEVGEDEEPTAENNQSGFFSEKKYGK